ncbi:tetracycline resistance protein [Minicystis rosea]|nr:tetracycline resistance protein [Minicystis rosea]
MNRKASLGTIFLTVFLDLLGFGLVVPYLPVVARTHGASALVATLLGASYSLMQLFFVPYWGQLSDRVGRRPVLVVSVGASVVGFLILANADALWLLFAARIWNGIATSNISVAQAYIADVTEPEDRAKGMGLIGAGIGIGFVLGPVVGGLLEAHTPFARAGVLSAYAGAALSLLNAVLAVTFLPESLPPERRGKAPRRASPLDLRRYREAVRIPGAGVAIGLNFVLVISFAAMEQTFSLFAKDAFGMTVRATGYVLGFVGLVLIAVQGGLLRFLSRAFAEATLVRAGILIQATGFFLLALSPQLGGLGPLYGSMGLIAFGSALTNPSLSAFVSRCADAQSQGTLLGVLQSAGALARVCGPATGGLLYQAVGFQAPYVAAGIGMLIGGSLALRLRHPDPVPVAADA